MKNNGRNMTIKLGKHQNTWRESKLYILRNIETNKDERKSQKRVPQKYKITSRNQTLKQKSNLDSTGKIL